MSLDLSALGIDFRAMLDRSPTGLLLLDAEGHCLFCNPTGCLIVGRSVEELAGMHYLELVAELDRPQLQDRVGVVKFEVQIERPDRQRTYVTGTMFDASESIRVMSMMDRTEDLRSQREIQAQSKIASRLTYGGSLEATMDELAANVGNAAGCLSCAVILCSPTLDSMRVVGRWNLPPGFVEFYNASFRAGIPLTTVEVMRSGQAIVKRNVRAQHRQFIAQMGVEMDPTWDVIVCLPLIYGQTVLGTLNCGFEEHYAPDERDMRFLQAIADQAAVSMENARLFAEVQGKAALEERQRLARDLHDSVSQALFGIGLGTRTALKLLDIDPSAVREPLNYVLSLAEAGLAEMRALIFELHPQSLESEGLVLALQKHVAALDSRHQVQVTSDLGEEPTLTPSIREALYRVAQESLNNIVKHAAAQTANVTLEARAEAIVLTVTDDGAGFDADGDFPGHLGLTSMQERMEKVGGRLMVTSAPGQGTRIQAVVPRI